MNDVGSWLAFVLQSALILAMLYLAYKWLLSRSTFYGLNRTILLLTIAVSWTLPLAVPYLAIQSQQSFGVAVDFPKVVGVVESPATEHTMQINWIAVVEWLYFAGCLVSLVACLIGAFRMIRIVRCGKKERMNGRTVVVSPSAPGPFSWGNYIILRTEDCDGDMQMVLEHEEEHLARYHWADLAMAQLTAILQWFNPAAWLMIRELKNLHEYEVDENLDKRYGKEYQIMLIRKTVGPSFPTFADSLNHSQIKNRLTMMMKNQSKPMRRLAVLAMPAMAALALVALSQPAVANVLNRFAPDETETIAPVSEGKVTNFQNDGQIDAVVASDLVTDVAESSIADSNIPAAVRAEAPATSEAVAPTPEPVASSASDEVYNTCEQLPEFQGGMGALMSFLIENIRFPEGVTLTKPERAVVQFTIGKDGSVSDLKLMKSAGVEALDQEALRVVEATSGKWSPGKNNGTPVAVKFTLPVTFASKAQ